MAALRFFVIFSALFALAYCAPGFFGHKHEHHTIHVPYKVHTIHHHHVKNVIKHVPVVKEVVKEIHVPVYKEIKVPVYKEVHVPVPVHVHHEDHHHEAHHDHHDYHKGWASSGGW